MALALLFLIDTAAWYGIFRHGLKLPGWLSEVVFYLMVFGCPTFLAFAISLGVFRHRANFLIALALLLMMGFAVFWVVGDLSI